MFALRLSPVNVKEITWEFDCCTPLADPSEHNPTARDDPGSLRWLLGLRCSCPLGGGRPSVCVPFLEAIACGFGKCAAGGGGTGVASLKPVGCLSAAPGWAWPLGSCFTPCAAVFVYSYPSKPTCGQGLL